MTRSARSYERWKLRRSRIASSPEDQSAVATFFAIFRSHQPRLPGPSISTERIGPPSRMRRRSFRTTEGFSPTMSPHHGWLRNAFRRNAMTG